MVAEESATISDGLVEDAPAAPPTLAPYTPTLQDTLLVHETTMRTLETGAEVEGEKPDTKLVVVESTSCVHDALQREIRVPAVVRRTS
jgi:hypothetical protein